MKKNKTNWNERPQGESSSPSPDMSDVVDIPPIATIEKWMSRDIASAVSLLNAILADKDLRMQVATFMHGRYSNHLEKQKIDPAQSDLFPKR